MSNQNQNISEVNNMASVSEDDDSFTYHYFSDESQSSRLDIENRNAQDFTHRKNTNFIKNLTNRQIYGRIAANPKAKTERLFENVHYKCRFALSALINHPEALTHIFMGFTLCGRYFVSYAEIFEQDVGNLMDLIEYELFLWRFVPGEKLQFVSKHKIFKHLKGSEVLDKVMIMQFPNDSHKLICYGLAATNPDNVYITIITLPSPKNCKHCSKLFAEIDESIQQGWCDKHGFIVHYMFSMSQPSPKFDPKLSLAFPNHLVINTGHYIHILNVTTADPPQTQIAIPFAKDDDVKLNTSAPYNDTFSETSETLSENFGSTSIVDSILEDFSEYDLESECGKPFHELNISCDPLNVTGKSYHNALVQNIVDPRFKRIQNKEYMFSIPQSSGLQKEKSKIDKKIAEKAYEFTEDNEKCEKLSSFRKKRLAEKKYEFSEDNSENIIPFNSLRRERRWRGQPRCIRSPDVNFFLSPRSPSMRSPMQSPNSRTGQFSPQGRNIYCSVRSSPHCKSPISPRDTARKFHVYSPSLEEWSDCDSRLIMSSHNHGLLIVDPKTESPKWIKKVVRRYSNGDFENGSLVSGQSRDDYNIPIEIPLLVNNLADQHFDILPDLKQDQTTEMQLIVTQRTFDCEMFFQRRAHMLCVDAGLEFSHCEDYDIKIVYVCPVNGHIICQAVIKIGALRKLERNSQREIFTANLLFAWHIPSNAFDVIKPKETKLFSSKESYEAPVFSCPDLVGRQVLVLDCNFDASKSSLRDYNNYYEVCLFEGDYCDFETDIDD